MTIQEKIQKAKEYGYSEDEIMEYLQKKEKTITPEVNQPNFNKEEYLKQHLINESQSQAMNPLLYKTLKTGAGVQKLLGNSPIYPLIFSILGKGIQPAPGIGSGLGAGVGEYLKQATAQGGIESLIPTKKNLAESAKTSSIYGGADILFKFLPYLNPFKTTGAIRNLGATGKTISGDKLMGFVDKAIKNVPEPYKSEMVDIAKQQSKSWLGQKIPVKELLNTKELANTIGRLASGREGRTSAATFMNIIGDAIRSEVKGVAPLTASADKLFSLLYGAKKQIGKFLPWVVGGALAGRGIGGE